ncbi:MAG: hypothetical protein KTR32_04400 [Granulosicoccus sp.]|nr:hypothetical protein [Granulosicoccus sp.]
MSFATLSFATLGNSCRAIGLLLLAGFLSPQAQAVSTPVADQIAQTGTPVYSNLAQANHVFGFRFRVLQSGSIDRLGGYFSGAKEVVIVNEADSIVASAVVLGTSTEFSWSTLASPLLVETGQVYRVLVRVGANQTSAAAWSVSMPFTQGGIEVLSLEQGWTSNTNPQEWVGNAQPLSDPHVRGLVDIQFTAGSGPVDDPDDPPTPPVEPPDEPNQPPIAGDPYPATVGVVDSFGQVAPSGPLGMGFMAVRAYYRDFPRQSGECSMEVHDRYWVRDSSGVTHPTWHPPIDPQTGCRFAHEHGDDPRTSPNYQFAEGVPFGLTHGEAAGTMRHEDHVGHKVVVQNNWGLVSGNPQNGRQPDSGVIQRTGISCDWLSKIHQGSWSRDALANNAHEYLLNLRCTDGVQLRLKQLVTFGPPEIVTNMCDKPAVTGEAAALANPNRLSETFPSGVSATSGIEVLKALDGKREFACLKNLMSKNQLEELWKSDGVVEFPGGGFIQFSPYYVVSNPARYLDHEWAARGAADGYVSSIDLCFNDNSAYRGQPFGYCDSVPSALGQLSSADRQRDIRNPMNGTRRVIHPKSIVVYTANEAGNSSLIRYCTDRLGRNARILQSGACTNDEIEQLVSRSDRRQWNWNGSDVNSINVSGQLRGAGYLNEWVRDFSAPGIRYPN